MFITCYSDATVFLINASLMSVAFLRHECHSLKSCIVLILALCDWIAILFGTFVARSKDERLWEALPCICKEHQALIQTGVLVITVSVLALNERLSDEQCSFGRQSFIHLVLFNATASLVTAAVIPVFASVSGGFGDKGSNDCCLGTTFLISVYRLTFLYLDCLYYVCLNAQGKKNKTIVLYV